MDNDEKVVELFPKRKFKPRPERAGNDELLRALEAGAARNARAHEHNLALLPIPHGTAACKYFTEAASPPPVRDPKS